VASEILKAAGALLRWEQRHLAHASAISLPTIKRLEAKAGTLAAHPSTIAALHKALEDRGVEFIEENSRLVGVRFRAAFLSDG
jgi:predicted transcriptional regulator